MFCKQSSPVKYDLPKKKLQPFADNSLISFDKTDIFFQLRLVLFYLK